jgi:hypothetical protein
MSKISEVLDLIIKHDQPYVSLFKIPQNLRDRVMDCEYVGEERRDVIGCYV